MLNFRLNESTQSLGRIANDLQGSVMRVRMLPISQLFQRFPRIVRDQALKLGKKVELTIEGGETEIDKRVLEQMNDPLVQFLRNAIVHGVETPEERKRLGKPETGSVRLAAYHAGDYVAIEIEDDGGGIDTQKLREILRTHKSISQHELDRLTDAEVSYSIFMPGISTYDKVDGSAGRGVGLDVVKQNVEHMNGTVEVESLPGHGTRFLIRIPLTVAIIRALLVKEAEQIFTLPLTSVTEILRHRPEETHSIEGFRVITLRGKTIPLVDLGELLNMQKGHQQNGMHKFVVIVSTSFRDVGLVVDGLMGEREVVIKSIENNLNPIEGFSGATILGDGRVSLIVDVSALLRIMKNSPSAAQSAAPQQYLN
jgi:two-component system chemotaxis sensor kinase CheA